MNILSKNLQKNKNSQFAIPPHTIPIYYKIYVDVEGERIPVYGTPRYYHYEYPYKDKVNISIASFSVGNSLDEWLTEWKVSNKPEYKLWELKFKTKQAVNAYIRFLKETAQKLIREHSSNIIVFNEYSFPLIPQELQNDKKYNIGSLIDEFIKISNRHDVYFFPGSHYRYDNSEGNQYHSLGYLLAKNSRYIPVYKKIFAQSGNSKTTNIENFSNVMVDHVLPIFRTKFGTFGFAICSDAVSMHRTRFDILEVLCRMDTVYPEIDYFFIPAMTNNPEASFKNAKLSSDVGKCYSFYVAQNQKKQNKAAYLFGNKIQPNKELKHTDTIMYKKKEYTLEATCQTYAINRNTYIKDKNNAISNSLPRVIEP